MQLTEITYDEAMPIEGYGPGFFRIGGQRLEGACLISPWGAGAWGGLEDTETPMTLVGRIDVLFVGMGAMSPMCRRTSATRWRRRAWGWR